MPILSFDHYGLKYTKPPPTAAENSPVDFMHCSLLQNQSPAEEDTEVWGNLGHLGFEKRRI